MILRILLVMFLVFIGIGSALYRDGLTQEQVTVTIEKLSYESLNLSHREIIENENVSLPVRIIYKGADFLTFTMLESGQYGIQFGYENPQYDYVFWAKAILIIMLLGAVIPIIYLLFFLWYLLVELIKLIYRFFTHEANKK